MLTPMRILLLLALLTGCSTASRKTFDVSVKNATSRTLTLGFVKTGPPFDADWASPEDLARLPPSRQPIYWGKPLPDGKTASIQVEGKFAHGAIPYLRIYSGEHTAAQLLAISRGTGDRLDLALTPSGDNHFILQQDSSGNLTAKLARLHPTH